MFNKVKTPEEGGVARDFFENRLDKSLLNHPDANILNIIINNRFIYPYYEQKVDMIKRMSENTPYNRTVIHINIYSIT